MDECDAPRLPCRQFAPPAGAARRSSHRHFLSALTAAAVLAGITSTLMWPPRPVLLWNASPSSPIGLYTISSPEHLRVGDTAIAWAPAADRRLAAARQYLPAEVPL